MAELMRAVPVLPALNIKDTVAFYENKLGFTPRHQEDEYGIITRDAIEIHFWKCDDKNVCEKSSCRLTVTGVDELYTHAQREGIVHPNASLETKPWGVREFAIIDVNGNLVWFVEPVAQ